MSLSRARFDVRVEIRRIRSFDRLRAVDPPREFLLHFALGERRMQDGVRQQVETRIEILAQEFRGNCGRRAELSIERGVEAAAEEIQPSQSFSVRCSCRQRPT